jgi:hypothetical protein
MPEYSARARAKYAREDFRARNMQRKMQDVEEHSVRAGCDSGVPATESPTALFGDSRLSGRGNGPVHVALMRQAQQTYGNRAIQRSLQLNSPPLSPRAPVQAAPVQRVGLLGTMGVLEFAAISRVIEETVRLAEAGGTLLRPDDVRTALKNRDKDPAVAAAFNNAAKAVMASSGAAAPLVAREMIRILEHKFLFNRKASSLDLLPPELRDRYKNFKWGQFDFPGHGKGQPAGANEGRASKMRRDLGDIRPERRANTGANALLVEAEYNKEVDNYIRRELRLIPGSEYLWLNRDALESFLRMRDAAAEDGVTLHVLSAFRSVERSRKKAAKSGNRSAIADFSSHNIGVAIDFRMSHGKQHFKELRTTPMQKVVDMRESPVHKWLFLKGAAFGWYPYHNEPWHWEYNPPGFQQKFREGLPPEVLAQSLLRGLKGIGSAVAEKAKKVYSSVKKVAKSVASSVGDFLSKFW